MILLIIFLEIHRGNYDKEYEELSELCKTGPSGIDEPC